MKYQAQEKASKTESVICMLIVWAAIFLLGWMQEDDRKSVLRDACAQTPEMEICSTLPKEK